MCKGHVRLWSVSLGVLCLLSQTVACGRGTWRAPEVQLRILADEVEDSDIVERAVEEPGLAVRSDGELVAEWVPLHRQYEPGHVQMVASGAVLRGEREILVRVTPLDVAMVPEEMFPTTTPAGTPVWHVVPSLPDQRSLEEFTDRYTGRMAVVIVDGLVWYVAGIHQRVNHFHFAAWPEDEAQPDWAVAAAQTAPARPPAERVPAVLWFLASGGFLLGLVSVAIILVSRVWRRRARHSSG